jgi:tetratricopeptide (TPR) repeat protein
MGDMVKALRLHIALLVIAGAVISPRAAQTGAAPWFLGVWHIADFKLPGQAALDSSEAEGWIGMTIKILAKQFIFDKDTCRPAEYETRRQDAVEFFQSIYRKTPADLGITVQAVEVTDVRCADRIVQTLISPDGKMLFVDYNGVFFVLARGQGVRRVPPVEVSPEERLMQAHQKAKALYKSGAKAKAAQTLLDGAGAPPWTVDSDNAPIYQDLGLFLVQAGQFQNAVDVLTTLLSAFPDRMQGYLYLGDAYAGLGITDQANTAYLHYYSMMDDAGKKKQVPARVLKAVQ